MKNVDLDHKIILCFSFRVITSTHYFCSKKKKIDSSHFLKLYIQNLMNFSFPKTPLLGYRTQPRRDLVRSPAGGGTAVTPPPSGGSSLSQVTAAASGLSRLPQTILRRKHKDVPAATAFLTTPAAALGQSGASFDGQCGHLLSLKPVLQLAQRQREVELPRLQLLVIVNRRNDVVELHLVGIADETSGILLQNVGDLDWIRKLLQSSIVQYQFCCSHRRRFARTANTHSLSLRFCFNFSLFEFCLC